MPPSPSPSGKQPDRPAPRTGRRRDPSRDRDILEAAIDTLAEVGFDRMTMDRVAAGAGAGKATLYRRWPSKGELVRDALIAMSRKSVDVEHVPDTGSLRDDLLAVMKPYSSEHSARKMRVLAGLGSFSSRHPKLAEAVTAGVYGPWTELNRTLMRRAVARHELPEGADLELALQVIVALTAHRTAAGRTFDRAVYTSLLDNLVLPGLKAKGAPGRPG